MVPMTIILLTPLFGLNSQTRPCHLVNNAAILALPYGHVYCLVSDNMAVFVSFRSSRGSPIIFEITVVACVTYNMTMYYGGFLFFGTPYALFMIAEKQNTRI